MAGGQGVGGVPRVAERVPVCAVLKKEEDNGEVAMITCYHQGGMAIVSRCSIYIGAPVLYKEANSLQVTIITGQYQGCNAISGRKGIHISTPALH